MSYVLVIWLAFNTDADSLVLTYPDKYACEVAREEFVAQYTEAYPNLILPRLNFCIPGEPVRR